MSGPGDVRRAILKPWYVGTGGGAGERLRSALTRLRLADCGGVGLLLLEMSCRMEAMLIG